MIAVQSGKVYSIMISVGLISDVHYAKDKVYGNRYCAMALERLADSLDLFQRENVETVICLGDLIDQGNDHEDDLRNLDQVADLLRRFPGDVHVVVGNHDLDALTKARFLKRLLERLPDTPRETWYSFEIATVQFLILDANFKKTGESYEPGNFTWDDTRLPDDQMCWLQERLNLRQFSRTVILSHQNLDERRLNGNIDPHVVANAAEVNKIISSSVMKTTVIQGHYHHGYYQHLNGIDYFTMKAMCDGDSYSHDQSRSTCAVLEIHDDNRFIIRGFGNQQTVELS